MNAQTAAQIFRSLKQLPALQRDEAIASTYVGLRVVWKTRFFEALDINRGSVKQFSSYSAAGACRRAHAGYSLAP
jgi:hypothetical protein